MEKLMTVIAVIGIVFAVACGDESESKKAEEPSIATEHSDVVSEDATQETGTATCATCTDINDRFMKELKAVEDLYEKRTACDEKRMTAEVARQDLDEIRIGYISDESDEDEIRSTVMDGIVMNTELTANTACLQAVLAEMHFQEVSRPTPDEVKARRAIQKIIRQIHTTDLEMLTSLHQDLAQRIKEMDEGIDALN